MTQIYKSLAAFLGATMLLCACSEDFLTPEPLSIYEPEVTFSTESGLKSVLAFCDRHIKLFYTSGDNDCLFPIATEYMFSDLMVAGATDKAGMLCDMAAGLTPTSLNINSDGRLFNSLNQTNSIRHFWHEQYYVIMQANTIIEYVDRISSLDEATKNMYKGRAYFHRAFRYYNLVFQFGDIPLLTRVTPVPKQNFRSTKRDAILEMITADMEKAVEWVPDQKEMSEIGMINKGACRMLLSKLYLATGRYAEAEEQLNILIDQSGYSLMKEPFGTFNKGGEPQTWPITRNIIWDLHRAENKLIPANKELIQGIVNRGSDAEGFVRMTTMRVLYPMYFNNQVKASDGKQALLNTNRTSSAYNKNYDYARALGRGIATFRPTYFSTHTLWMMDGEYDKGDLRHSSAVGNWVRMEDLKVNNTASSQFGQNLSLAQKAACLDTIRRWFDVPHYKLFLNDPVEEAKQNTQGLTGATNGGNADWYLYRLAEAYLLRAEAKFYQGKAADATEDVNIIRRRAHCEKLYSGEVSIGDIMDERARELYLEEWRHVELVRVSLCLARSGKSDEWGNTYSIDNFDKQSGTEPEGGSYWYQRTTKGPGKLYNRGPISVSATLSTINYTMAKHNIYWPIHESTITANSKGRLAQNYGYDGYDPATPKWETWQEAVADELVAD